MDEFQKKIEQLLDLGWRTSLSCWRTKNGNIGCLVRVVHVSTNQRVAIEAETIEEAFDKAYRAIHGDR